METYYIEYLNKNKGFEKTRIDFDSYEKAVKWGVKNLDFFNHDMVKIEFN